MMDYGFSHDSNSFHDTCRYYGSHKDEGRGRLKPILSLYEQDVKIARRLPSVAPNCFAHLRHLVAF